MVTSRHSDRLSSTFNLYYKIVTNIIFLICIYYCALLALYTSHFISGKILLEKCQNIFAEQHGKETLSALTQMNMHYDLPIHFDKIVDKFKLTSHR